MGNAYGTEVNGRMQMKRVGLPILAPTRLAPAHPGSTYVGPYLLDSYPPNLLKEAE